MLSVLANRTYRYLFAAQVIALIGTGMMTVALGLLAFKIAGDNAGAVLGTALAIKMVAYVGVAPVVGGFANLLPRRAFLVSMDLTRANIVAFAILSAVATTAATAQQTQDGSIANIDEPKGTITILLTPSGTVGANGANSTQEFRLQDGLLFNAFRYGDKVTFTTSHPTRHDCSVMR